MPNTKKYYKSKTLEIAIYNLNSWPEIHGGSEISCKELAEELIKLDLNVTLLSLQPFKKGFSTTYLSKIKILKLPLLNIYWPLENKNRS